MTPEVDHRRRPPPRSRGVERALEPTRRKYQAEFERLVSAARDVMSEHGTVDPTIGQVLAVAGLSTNAFYRHFPTKDDLLLELVMQAGANTRSFLSHRMAQQDTPRERVIAWIEGMFDLLGTRSSLRANRPFLFAHPRLVTRFPNEVTANIDLLVEPLAIAIHDLRPGSRQQSLDDAHLLYHQVFGILLDRAAMARLSDAAEVKRVVEYSLRALLTPPRASDLEPDPQASRLKLQDRG
jgi:AcrR family transcriptional regulator